MKSTNVICSLILSMSINARAAGPQIGGVDGGGGVGVRCPASSGAPKAFELLDLHEARLNGFLNPMNPQGVDQSTALIVDMLTNLFMNPDMDPVSKVKSVMTGMIEPMFVGGSWTAPGGTTGYTVHYVTSLPLSSDIGSYRIIPGCQLEQIAYFDDTTATLSIASNWNDLDWVDRAALVTHELMYYSERTDDAMEYFDQNIKMTSERARVFVGQLFSTVTITSHGDSIPKTGFAKCNDSKNSDTDYTYGWIYDDGFGGTVAVFNGIHGHGSAYQMKATFPNVSVEALTDVPNGLVNTSSALLQFSSEADVPIFVLKISKQPGAPVAFDLYENHSGQLVSMAPTQALSCFYPQP